MRTLGTRVRTQDAEDFKAWCAMRGVSTTSEIKRFVMSELEKYNAVMEKQQNDSKNK